MSTMLVLCSSPVNVGCTGSLMVSALHCYTEDTITVHHWARAECLKHSQPTRLWWVNPVSPWLKIRQRWRELTTTFICWGHWNGMPQLLTLICAEPVGLPLPGWDYLPLSVTLAGDSIGCAVCTVQFADEFWIVLQCTVFMLFTLVCTSHVVRIMHNMDVLVYKALPSPAPVYIKSMCVPVSSSTARSSLHSASRGHLIVPRTRLEFGKRVFAFAGSAAWNSLPDIIRSAWIH